jgi:hypothetical protein
MSVLEHVVKYSACVTEEECHFGIGFWVNKDSAKRSFEIVSSLKHVLHFPLRKFWLLLEGDTLLTFYPMIVYRVLQTDAPLSN